MNNNPILCSSCGTALDAASPGGLCPRCLMAGALVPTDSPTGTRHSSPTVEQVAAVFPNLEVLALIGVGGMGAVFRARQTKLNRLVALKVLPASLVERDPTFAERFEREGQMLAKLHHPNIVTIYDSGRAGDFFYLLMEYVDGVNLRQAMRASRFTAAQALAIVPRICDALQFAHEEGVLHRDIKPENILLDAKGRVKLADFGIAKMLGAASEPASIGTAPATHDAALTQAGTALGTPQYMSPEQFEHPNEVDNRADIYSLGVVFYELLTGELPVGKFAPPSEKSGTDPRVDEIVRQALEKERGHRQRSAGEVRMQVETLVNSTATSNSGPRSASAQSGSGKRLLLYAALFFVAIGILAAGIFAFRYGFPSATVSPRAALQESPTLMESWAPALSPGEKPNLQNIRQEATDLAQKGQYEEALQRIIWYHQHALEFEPAQSAVRLSFALSQWAELARRYPKAKEALVEMRDRGTREFTEGGGYFELFMEVSAINEQLGQKDATYALFKSIQARDPKLARQCYHSAEDLLVEKGDYALCASFILDFQKRFESIRAMWARTSEIADPAPERETSMHKHAQRAFIKDTRKLIEILVGVGRKAEAENIRDQAVAVLDVPELHSAVADAEQRVAKLKPAGQ